METVRAVTQPNKQEPSREQIAQSPSVRDIDANSLPQSNLYSRHLLLRRGRFSVLLSPRELVVAIVLALGCMLMAGFAATVGKLPISLAEIYDAISGVLSGASEPNFKTNVLFNIRFPRILTALFAGAALGVSGAIFQSISRNVLGSPDIIGFTSGAATGALMQIILFGGGAVEISLSAIAGGLVTALIVYCLALKNGTVGRYRLILTGIGISAVLSALNGLLLVKGNLDNAISAQLWLAGSLHSRNWHHAVPVIVSVLVLLPLAKGLARSLMMAEMGDDLATQLGVRVDAARWKMTLIAVVLAATATSAAGPIAFIALAAPQLARKLRRSANLPLISSALMGGALLLSADLCTQLIPLQLTLPIGRVTGLIGGVYLLWLLLQSSTHGDS
uniref:FecCD family ABC transporter permease n=1 Tax=Thaumasiovibrio occultus TaxID=1891184 RepID=UPI000B35DB50|nr:iron chelate uptake ABC transporter family permease subunit [Thaumasiovibrio occultus]